MLIKFEINGRETELEVEDTEILLDVIREKLHLLGTKRGCENGECGACTVLVNGNPINSCIYPAIRANGKNITTIEGLGETDKLHPIQEAFIRENALQCGFCGPGILLNGKALLEKNSTPTEEEIRKAISGHLCRCSGYEKITKAIKSAGKEIHKMEG